MSVIITKKKASYKQFEELCSGLLEQVQIICSCNCYNVLLRMPRSMEYLMAKVQAFYCNVIFLSLSCNRYTARLEDLAWLTKLSRCLKTNILLIISVKYVKEIVVGASHYRPEREIHSKKPAVRWSTTNYKQKFIPMWSFSILKHMSILSQVLSIACFLCMYTFTCHHYLIPIPKITEPWNEKNVFSDHSTFLLLWVDCKRLKKGKGKEVDKCV